MDPDALLADLDADQLAAVTAESHLVAVIAGAGSGKTRVLTRRIAYRIENGSADARHTLALTFTREAAGEVRRRLLRLGLRERVEAGTFHSVMLGVLKQRWADIGRRPLTVVADRRRLVLDTLAGGDRRGVAPFVAEIDWAAARGISADSYASAARRSQRRPPLGVERCAAVYKDYDRIKKQRGVIDFDDVLSHSLRDLRRDPEFADSIRWRFRHLLVDEAQDLNPLQHQLVDILREGRDDLFLVGDPSQAIYGFNGADPALLIDVETRFPGIEIVRLPVNHRSTPQIVSAGVHVLTVSDQPSPLVSNRGDGHRVEEVTAQNEDDEVELTVQFVLRSDPNLIRTGEIAVLARTNRQLTLFDDALRSAGLPVRRAATASGSPLQAAVRRAASLGSASRLRAWAHDVLDAPVPLIDPTPAETRQYEHQHRNDNSPRRRPEVSTNREGDPERRVAAGVLEFLRDQTLGDGAGFRSWVATTNPFDDASTDGVALLTFHASKGREWHTVIVSGIESSLVPHKSATNLAAKAEEGRLLYVATTRATDRLLLTHAERRGGYTRTVSPYIVDLDLDETPAAPPPPRHRRTRSDTLLSGLRSWRSDAARNAGVLPDQLCSDRDLGSIARLRPSSVDELIDATSFGPVTARRLAIQLLPIVDAAQSSQEVRSTITGA